MRLLVINLLYPPIQFGGAEKAARLLAEAFARRGDDVSVISLHPGTDELIEQRNNVSIYRLPMDNLYWPFASSPSQSSVAKLRWHIKDIWNRKAARRVGRILDEVKPDVVHTHVLTGLSVSVWKEVKKRNIRLVHTMHDYYLLCARSGLFRNGRNCIKPCIECRALTAVPKNWSRQVDAAVAVSDHVLKKHQRHGYFTGVPGHVVYNINHSLAETTTTELHHNSHGLVFGYIGRLTPEKGIRTLLSATKLLSSSDWKLSIAGDGDTSFVAELKREFKDPRIEWLGFVQSNDFYRSIDVTVIPSVWQDPLPYVTIESFAAGKGVICAASGGLPELARLGKTVKTYPAGDARALADAMEHSLKNRADWSDGGFITDDTKLAFSEGRVVSQYKAIYDNLPIEV